MTYSPLAGVGGLPSLAILIPCLRGDKGGS